MWLIEVPANNSPTSAGGCTYHSNRDASCAYGPTIAPRHNDGANFAYLDGHSKWQKITTTQIWLDPVLAEQLRYNR